MFNKISFVSKFGRTDFINERFVILFLKIAELFSLFGYLNVLKIVCTHERIHIHFFFFWFNTLIFGFSKNYYYFFIENINIA